MFLHLYSLFSSANISVYFRWLVVCLFLLCLTLEFGFCRDSSRRSTSTQKRFRADQSALMYGINVAVCRLDDLLNKKLSLVSRESWAVAKDVSAASCPRILPIPLIPFSSYFREALCRVIRHPERARQSRIPPEWRHYFLLPLGSSASRRRARPVA